MIATKKLILISILLVSSIGCDQTTKGIAKSSLQDAFPQSLLNGLLLLQYAENPGGMMSFGAGLHPEVRFWFLTVFVGVMLLGMFLFTLFSRKLTIMQITALTLIVGGGFSNLLDRIFNDGHVVDFLNVGIGSMRTAIFNIADVVILLGTLLLLIATPFQNGKSGGQTPEHIAEK
ncbi:MAG: signal peptidase II [Bacteroidetes bacterium]|nr:signal peptidase II [Bacteroidota bacterium]MCW5895943.1 signal peptidase II [Bacteroidota bacterium]